MELAGRYAVKFIRDDQLPPEQEWMLLECGGDTYVVIKESCICERVLEDVWSAYRRRVVDAPAVLVRRAS